MCKRLFFVRISHGRETIRLFLRKYKLTINMNDLKLQLVHIYAATELPGAACMPSSCFFSSFLLPRLLDDLPVPGVEVGTAEVLAHQLCV
jgi:hypothetical protein